MSACVCQVHDADDVVPGRICGRKLPCRYHEPTRSGTPTMPRAARAARGRPLVTLSLSSEALARLDAIAAERGQTRSGAVEQLVRNARMREPESR